MFRNPARDSVNEREEFFNFGFVSCPENPMNRLSGT